MHGTLNVMDPTGHTKITWDASNAEETRVARDTFGAMIEKGFSAFRTARGGGRGDRITSFDPQAESIILVPHLVGG